MESDEIVLTPLPTQQSSPARKKTFPIRLFSLFVLITSLVGVWEWYGHYLTVVGGRAWGELTRSDLLDLLEYDNGLGMEEIVLKYKVYRIPVAGYAEPNILLALCILLTFPYVLNRIESETATPIAFFELNLSSIYLQLLRLGVDLMHYLLTSKCICLASGAGAVWVHLLTKLTCYNAQALLRDPLRLLLTITTFLVAFAMAVVKDRLDLLIAIAAALLDVAFLEGGTVKFPKDVFQEKEEWAGAVRLSRLPLWQTFHWNEYKANERLCVDSIQYFVPRKERMILIS